MFVSFSPLFPNPPHLPTHESEFSPNKNQRPKQKKTNKQKTTQ